MLCNVLSVIYILLLIKAKKQKGEISNVSGDDSRVQNLFSEDTGSNSFYAYLTQK